MSSPTKEDIEQIVETLQVLVSGNKTFDEMVKNIQTVMDEFISSKIKPCRFAYDYRPNMYSLTVFYDEYGLIVHYAPGYYDIYSLTIKSHRYNEIVQAATGTGAGVMAQGVPEPIIQEPQKIHIKADRGRSSRSISNRKDQSHSHKGQSHSHAHKDQSHNHKSQSHAHSSHKDQSHAHSSHNHKSQSHKKKKEDGGSSDELDRIYAGKTK